MLTICVWLNEDFFQPTAYGKLANEIARQFGGRCAYESVYADFYTIPHDRIDAAYATMRLHGIDCELATMPHEGFKGAILP